MAWTLHRKLLRDLVHLRGQVITIALRLIRFSDGQVASTLENPEKVAPSALSW